MAEGEWHKKVRKKLIKKYEEEEYQVESSHENKVIGLYRGALHFYCILHFYYEFCIFIQNLQEKKLIAEFFLSLFGIHISLKDQMAIKDET